MAGVASVSVVGVTGVSVAGVTGVSMAGVTGVSVAGVTGVSVAGVVGISVAGIAGVCPWPGDPNAGVSEGVGPLGAGSLKVVDSSVVGVGVIAWKPSRRRFSSSPIMKKD